MQVFAKMKGLVVSGLFFLLVVSSISCSGNQQEPEPQELTAKEVRAKHDDMFKAVKDYLDTPELFVDGQWKEHFGDGNLFGPSYDLLQYKLTKKKHHLDRAKAALEKNRELVAAAAKDLTGHLSKLEDVSMALLSLMEAGMYLPESETKEYLKAADALIEPLDQLAIAMGDYLDTTAGKFAAVTYGPTALTAFLALLHFEHAHAYPNVNREKHIKRGTSILAKTLTKVWDKEMGAFRFAPKDTRRMLYPNITMMAAYARAYQVTKDKHFLTRFEETYKGIQPLKNKAGDHYHSPYSAEEMKSKDEDYSTLSSQNYLMLGLWITYTTTKDVKYLKEIDTIMTWVKEKLHVKGKILHHWVNGRAANDEDPWVYCLGCNAQTLFILSLIEAGLNEASK